jgi:hypothetical protein
MGYLGMLARAASNGMGRPPANPRNVGTPPAAQPHIEAAPYDVAQDPGWAKILDPADHALRNFLNEISPEQRQMLQQRVMQYVQKAVGGIPAVSGITDTAKAIHNATVGNPLLSPGGAATPPPQ